MRRAMEGAEGFEGLENHEGQSALPDVGFVAHRGISVTSCGKPIAVAPLLWLRNRKRTAPVGLAAMSYADANPAVC